MHADTVDVGNKGHPAYWSPFPHPYIPHQYNYRHTIRDGGPAVGRPGFGHRIGQPVPVSGLHDDLGTSNFPQRSGHAVPHPVLPAQVLVPSSMKNSDGECNSLSLPEGRVHGGHLMAMLSRGLEIGDSGQSSQGYEQNRMPGHGSWM